MAEIVNGKRLAAILDVTTRTISTLRKEGMPVFEDKGRGKPTLYDTGECFRWLLARDSGNEKDPPLRAARLRILEAEAERREIHLAKEKGKVVDIAVVGKTLERLFQGLRSRILSLPHRLASQVIACNSVSEIHGIATNMVHECLDELSTTKIFHEDEDHDG